MGFVLGCWDLGFGLGFCLMGFCFMGFGWWVYGFWCKLLGLGFWFRVLG